MDFIKIRFGSDFDQKCSECDKSLEELFHSVNPMFCLSERSWKPQMDIYETEETIVIQAALSGVPKENLEVEISDKAVRICGCRSPKAPSEAATYRLVEIQHGRFERILFLPAAIDTDKVSATYLNGFLQVSLTKLPLNRTTKIPIQDG